MNIELPTLNVEVDPLVASGWQQDLCGGGLRSPHAGWLFAGCRCRLTAVQSLLTTIARRIEEENLPVLMIGGHAVTALGHPRATFDLDLLIPRSAAEKWRVVRTALNYRSFAESANFHQYEAPEEFPLPPVDLMLVDDAVFHALEQTKTDTRPIATPGVEALIALKLHAIRQPGRDDAEKDWSDILALIRAHRLTLDDPEFSATVLRHGGQTAIQRIQAAIAG